MSGRGARPHHAETDANDRAHEAQDEYLGGNIEVGSLEVEIEEDLPSWAWEGRAVGGAVRPCRIGGGREREW